MKTIYLVAGARPNFMKIAPIVRALKIKKTLAYRIIHTGQHYDPEMNEVFDELGIPQPDIFMGVGGGSHAQQTAKIMIAFEDYCLKDKPDAVLVVGDVNSTLACSIVAKNCISRLRMLKPDYAAAICKCQKKSTGWSPTAFPTGFLSPNPVVSNI